MRKFPLNLLRRSLFLFRESLATVGALRGKVTTNEVGPRNDNERDVSKWMGVRRAAAAAAAMVVVSIKAHYS